MSIRVSNIVVVDDNKNLTNINSATFIGSTSIKVPAGTTGERPVGTPGDFRFNTTDNAFEGYTNAWGGIGGGGVGGGAYSSHFANVFTVGANTTSLINSLYVLSSNLTLTLPASPLTGNAIGISNQTGYANSVIARNGKKIMGLDEDMTIDVIDTGFTLIYTNTTNGWVII